MHVHVHVLLKTVHGKYYKNTVPMPVPYTIVSVEGFASVVDVVLVLGPDVAGVVNVLFLTGSDVAGVFNVLFLTGSDVDE